MRINFLIFFPMYFIFSYLNNEYLAKNVNKFIKLLKLIKTKYFLKIIMISILFISRGGQDKGFCCNN